MEISGSAQADYKGTERFTDVNQVDYKFAEKKFVSKRSCFRCGFTNHMIKDCRMPSSIVCRNCGKKGHMQVACKGAKIDMKIKYDKKVNYSNAMDRNDDYDDDNYCVFNITDEKVKPYVIELKVNNENVKFIIDTGSPVTIISESVGKKVCGKNELLPSKHDLTCYAGFDIEILGMTNVDIIHNGSNFCLPLFIVKGDKPSLLGRDWLKKVKLDWKNVLGQISFNGKNFLEKILSDHSSVFDGDF